MELSFKNVFNLRLKLSFNCKNLAAFAKKNKDELSISE